MIGDYCVYHTGELPINRKGVEEHSKRINELADTVRLLSELGYLHILQRKVDLIAKITTMYTARKTGRGYVPKAIMSGELTSFDWRALKSIRDRAADVSATRAVRDALFFIIPHQKPEAILDNLKHRQFVQEAPGKGWELSRAGQRILI